MSKAQLRQRYGEVFGVETNGRNKVWLVKRIAWRLQVQAEGASPNGVVPEPRNWPTRPTCGRIVFFDLSDFRPGVRRRRCLTSE